MWPTTPSHWASSFLWALNDSVYLSLPIIYLSLPIMGFTTPSMIVFTLESPYWQCQSLNYKDKRGHLWNHCPKGRWLRQYFLGSGSTNTQTWTRLNHSISQEGGTNKLWFLLRLWLPLQVKWPWSGLSKGAETSSQRMLRTWSCLFILWGLHSRGYCRAQRNV